MSDARHPAEPCVRPSCLAAVVMVFTGFGKSAQKVCLRNSRFGRFYRQRTNPPVVLLIPVVCHFMATCDSNMFLIYVLHLIRCCESRLTLGCQNVAVSRNLLTASSLTPINTVIQTAPLMRAARFSLPPISGEGFKCI